MEYSTLRWLIDETILSSDYFAIDRPTFELILIISSFFCYDR